MLPYLGIFAKESDLVSNFNHEDGVRILGLQLPYLIALSMQIRSAPDLYAYLQFEWSVRLPTGSYLCRLLLLARHFERGSAASTFRSLAFGVRKHLHKLTKLLIRLLVIVGNVCSVIDLVVKIVHVIYVELGLMGASSGSEEVSVSKKNTPCSIMTLPLLKLTSRILGRSSRLSGVKAPLLCHVLWKLHTGGPSSILSRSGRR